MQDFQHFISIAQRQLAQSCVDVLVIRELQTSGILLGQPKATRRPKVEERVCFRYECVNSKARNSAYSLFVLHLELHETREKNVKPL